MRRQNVVPIFLLTEFLVLFDHLALSQTLEITLVTAGSNFEKSGGVIQEKSLRITFKTPVIDTEFSLCSLLCRLYLRGLFLSDRKFSFTSQVCMVGDGQRESKAPVIS